MAAKRKVDSARPLSRQVCGRCPKWLMKFIVSQNAGELGRISHLSDNPTLSCLGFGPLTVILFHQFLTGEPLCVMTFVGIKIEEVKG
jgi:hypothetical protein